MLNHPLNNLTAQILIEWCQLLLEFVGFHLFCSILIYLFENVYKVLLAIDFRIFPQIVEEILVVYQPVSQHLAHPYIVLDGGMRRVLVLFKHALKNSHWHYSRVLLITLLKALFKGR